jgi:hypothetical protein
MHPLDARLVRDLGLDYLIGRALAPAGESHLDVDYDDLLDAGLEDVATFADLRARVADWLARATPAVADRAPVEAAWAALLEAQVDPALALERLVDDVGALVLRWEGAKAFEIQRPLDSQLSRPALRLLRVLALARHGLHTLRTGDPLVPLAAPLRPRAAIPPRPGWAAEGADGLELVEIADLIDPRSAEGRRGCALELADLAPRVRWRLVHMPELLDEGRACWAATVAEAALEIEPPAFWAVVDRLADDPQLARRRDLRAAVAGIVDAQAIAGVLATGRPEAAVLRDYHMAVACGVPRWRPQIALGTRLYGGPSRFLRRALERRSC